MKGLFKLFASLFVAITLVLAGGLFDVYAETPKYETEFSAVKKTEKEILKTNIEENPKTIEEVINPNVIPSPTYVAPQTTPVSVPDLSNHLEMPSIGVYKAVQTVGINSAGEIDVPASNIGLWTSGAQPGQNGVVFLVGHVFGVFTSLKNTQVGSEFSLTWNGLIYRYRVIDNKTYSIDYLNQTTNGVWAGILNTPKGGSKGLNIMTCAGQPQGNTYSHRTVIYAYQIN